MKYAFIRDHRDCFPVRSLCRVLEVSASGYYDWLDRPMSLRQQEDQRLLGHIRRIHHQSRQNYGGRKVWRALNREGIACGKHRVERLRRLHGIEAKRRARFKVTTQSKRHHWAAPDRVRRRFSTERPNQVWVGDVTFIPTRGGWLYLAMLLDLYSRKVVGWSMSDRNNQALVLNALSMALKHRQPGHGLIHHTDRGQLYCAREYTALLERHGIKPSMGRKGDCYDNAVAESFFNNLKNELIHGQRFETREEAKAAIFDYIEIFYNRQRLHQTLGYQSPHEFEIMNRAA